MRRELKKRNVKKFEGRLFGWTANPSNWWYVNQLSYELYLPTRGKTQMHRPTRYSGKYRICSGGGRSYDRRWDCERFIKQHGQFLKCSWEKRKNGYHDLKCNLVDMVVEEQAKLGYNKEAIRLYYPLSSLNHILNTSLDTEEMLSYLIAFPAYVEKICGEVKFPRKKSVSAFTLEKIFRSMCILTKPVTGS